LLKLVLTQINKYSVNTTDDHGEYMANTHNNPLSAYFRSPKLYTTIPSGGKFYTDDILTVPDTGEFAIYPMTTKDELQLKNPDALLNGEAVSNLIKSCVPEIKQPKKLMSADVDALLIAIRGASGGDDVNVSATCDKCETVTDFVISVESALLTMETLERSYELPLANGLTFVALPFSYASSIKAGIASFQSSRSMQSISELTDDMDRLKAFNESFVKLADLNFELIVDSIYAIAYTDESGEVQEVTDKASIREFLENCDKETGKQVEEFVNSINKKGVKQEAEVTCSNEECNNVYTAPINFDPVNFFTGS
jgi:hypothetical protein